MTLTMNHEGITLVTLKVLATGTGGAATVVETSTAVVVVRILADLGS
jgi:hypothetical protein